MTSKEAEKEELSEAKRKFLMSLRCWVYPYCYLPASREKCYRIIASGLKCGDCPFEVEDEKKARELQGIYDHLIIEKEKKHYDFIKTKYWKNEIRRKILQYDDYKCIICKEKLDTKKAQIHHISDFSADEDLSPRNLVTLCSNCHAKLHPVFPKGMWLLGWPNLNKVKIELKNFYENVRVVSEENKERFKAPLEHIMMHICLICPFLDKCEVGKWTLHEISTTMKHFDLLLQKYCRISDIRDGMKHLIVEGTITKIDTPKIVETRYGKTKLAVATLRDESGEITLNLWGNQIGIVKVGDNVRVEKGYTRLYEGKLTLNVHEWGRIIKKGNTDHLNSVKEMESYPYHKILVDKLEGSSFEGKFSEVSILQISKNQHYQCPTDCLNYEKWFKWCRYKKPLMNNPVKDELVCTTVLAEIKSSLPPDMGTLLVSDTNRILDSGGKSYRGFSSYLCEKLHSQAKKKFGYISRGEFDWIKIFEGTKETILLPFPEIPQKETVVGIILQLWSRKGVSNKSVETFDFRLRS